MRCDCTNDNCPTYVDSQGDEREWMLSELVYEGDTGASYLTGRAEDACPACGEDWGSVEHADKWDYMDPDDEYERRMEAREMDRDDFFE